MWDECNCVVVWTFLWGWDKNPPFPVLWPLPSFPNLLAYWGSTFTTSSFRIWNSSNGIPSPPLALFIVMLSKAHLTSHSRMSGSCEWSHHCDYLGHEDLFLQFSVYSCHLFLISSASVQFSSVQSLSHVWFFATPWTAACQASLFITISRSSLRLTSI